MTEHTFVIAEAGVNHNGDLGRALAMVKAAAAAGADAIKFQTFCAADLVTATAPMAGYQARNLGRRGSQFDMLATLELSRAGHRRLAIACGRAGIEFMSTPFDRESARFLIDDIGVRRLKVASGEIGNAPLLLDMGRSRKPIVLSTGMATLADVRAALGVIAFGYTAPRTAKPTRAAFRTALASRRGREALKRRVTILHCTSAYPAPAASINLKAMDSLRREFNLPVGLSDHSEGISVAMAAVARGATMIEKHFTLDRALPGPDHVASLTVDELTTMIRGIRDVEQAFGDGRKRPAAVEQQTMSVARKSLVALRSIAKGETFTAMNLGVKRPAGGVAPLDYWAYLGRRSRRSYAADERIKPQ